MMSPLFTLQNVLMLTAVVLAVALGFETEWGNAMSAPPAIERTLTGKLDSAKVLPDFRLQSETGTYAQISERPLLNPTRKPAPTQLVIAASEPPKPQVRRGLYQLIGVMDLGTVKVAQVRELISNRTKSVREGDALQEMTVKEVLGTQVTLAFQGETDVLELAKFTPSGRVPQPPASLAQSVTYPRPMPTAQVPSNSVAQAAGQSPRPFPQAMPMPAQTRTPGPSPATAPTAAASTAPVAPQREAMNVVEMLERRRLARQQAGGQ